MSRGSNGLIADMARGGDAFNAMALRHMGALDLAARIARLGSEMIDIEAEAEAWEAARQERQREYQERTS